MPHDLHSLLYLSEAHVRFSAKDLTDLLDKSRRFNLEHNITGLLMLAHGQWIGLLEGERKVIEELMVRIGRDTRHRDIEVIEKGPVTSREFTDWAMAFLDGATPEVRALPGYSTFLEEPLDWETPAQAGRGVQMLNYFKAIMLASDDSIAGLVQSAEIQQQAPVLAGKLAAAKRRS